MSNRLVNFMKAAIISLIVAFLFVLIVCLFFNLVIKEKFDMAINLIKIITINEDNSQTIKPVLEGNILINYPTFGTKYADLKIDSINLNLPVYYGANYTILKSGIAHDENSYFPGEGGSVILAGHNFKTFLAELPNAKTGDKICLETTYGIFNYEIYDTKIVKETAVGEVPVQKDEEILMIYTCWPINNIGHASERYVVYAKPVKE